MAFSPTKIDAATITAAGITGVSDVDLEYKKLFLQSQITEMKKMAWRERTDIVMSERLMEDTNELLAEKARQNRAEHLNNLKQFVRSIETLTMFAEELEK